MPSITKQEALRRLAIEVMDATPIPEDYWNPFTDLNDAFELQARLTGEQLHDVVLDLASKEIFTYVLGDCVACLTATADQRTRAIVRVLWGVEVEG